MQSFKLVLSFEGENEDVAKEIERIVTEAASRLLGPSQAGGIHSEVRRNYLAESLGSSWDRSEEAALNIPAAFQDVIDVD